MLLNTYIVFFNNEQLVPQIELQLNNSLKITLQKHLHPNLEILQTFLQL